MGVIIATNIVVMVIETNADASCLPMYQDNLQACPTRSTRLTWLQAESFLKDAKSSIKRRGKRRFLLVLQVMNVALLIIYSIECGLRAFVEREGYLWNRWPDSFAALDASSKVESGGSRHRGARMDRLQPLRGHFIRWGEPEHHADHPSGAAHARRARGHLHPRVLYLGCSESFPLIRLILLLYACNIYICLKITYIFVII